LRDRLNLQSQDNSATLRVAEFAQLRKLFKTQKCFDCDQAIEEEYEHQMIHSSTHRGRNRPSRPPLLDFWNRPAPQGGHY
jgi:hypothetical protein